MGETGGYDDFVAHDLDLNLLVLFEAKFFTFGGEGFPSADNSNLR